MESIYVEVKKTWGFYTPSNLDAVFSNTSEAQRCISAEVQETDNAFAKLQVEDDGNSNIQVLCFIRQLIDD